MPTRQVKILLAEDEAPLRNLIRLSLESRGYQLNQAGDGLEALIEFERDRPDLVILDVMMPNMDGFACCQELRKRSDVPIIILTARGSVDDIVRGFELGADDYITKPFVFKELEARIQAILRRIDWGEHKPPRIIRNGRVWLASDPHEVRVEDAQVHLTPIEFQLLYYLMSHTGQAISKDILFRKVWGYDFVGGTNLVEVGVRRLREKIEVDPSNPEYIQTVRGVGYRFREPDDSDRQYRSPDLNQEPP